MAMAAAAWDVLAKAANLAQMFAMFVAVFTSLQRVQRSNKRQCAELEQCIRRLHTLLQWPATCPGAALLLCSEVEDPFGKALRDAAGLVDSYKKSTLWRRVRSGGKMATQLRDMQDLIDSYCGLLLFVNAHLLLQPQSVQHQFPRRRILLRFLRRMTHRKVQVHKQEQVAPQLQGLVALKGPVMLVREEWTTTQLDVKETCLLCCL